MSKMLCLKRREHTYLNDEAPVTGDGTFKGVHQPLLLSDDNMKAAGIEDRKIYSVSGHKNIQSLQAYDRTTEAEAIDMAAAIDGSEPPAKKKFTFVCTSHEQKENDPPQKEEAVPPAIIQARGATFNNVTFNLQVTTNMPK